jgi:hypothetical protein
VAKATGWQDFGERMFGFWIELESCTGVRSSAYWFTVYSSVIDVLAP